MELYTTCWNCTVLVRILSALCPCFNYQRFFLIYPYLFKNLVASLFLINLWHIAAICHYLISVVFIKLTFFSVTWYNVNTYHSDNRKQLWHNKSIYWTTCFLGVLLCYELTMASLCIQWNAIGWDCFTNTFCIQLNLWRTDNHILWVCIMECCHG